MSKIFGAWKFFLEYFLLDVDPAFHRKDHESYWLVTSSINAALGVGAFFATRFIANQTWWGFENLALVWSLVLAVVVFTFCFTISNRLTRFIGYGFWQFGNFCFLVLLVRVFFLTQ